MTKIIRKPKPGVERNKTELIWDGKRTDVEKISLPFQVVESINEPRVDREEIPLFAGQKKEAPIWRNRLIWGDNKYIMGSLLDEFAGKINLIYIDPPFATGADFSINMKVGDVEWTKEASVIEEKAYRDTWGKGLDSYLQMMYDRLVLMRELLADNGSIYVHLDWHVGHYVKIMMDEIFGQENFRNEIVWCYTGPSRKIEDFPDKHDLILRYSKTEKRFLNIEDIKVPYSESFVQRRQYTEGTGGIYGGRERDTSDLSGFKGGKVPEDWWDDIPSGGQISRTELLGFPTQKPEKLLERIIKASSNKGDLVADFFCGSGTTGAVAEKLGRRWIMADLSKFAIHTTRKRLLDIPSCKPFEILNFGNYQKQKFIENNYPPVKKYVEFMLKLYRAKEVLGYHFIHGKKAGKLVHISNVDSMVTEAEVRDVLKEVKESRAKAIDILGWDYTAPL